MYQTIITEIEQNMLPHLNNEQLEVLHATLFGLWNRAINQNIQINSEIIHRRAPYV